MDMLSVRDGCVECLFGLLGSDSYKKENEVALICGEALAIFADCTRVKGSGAENLGLDSLDEAFNPSYAASLPFFKSILYRALTKEVRRSESRSDEQRKMYLIIYQHTW